MPSKVSMLLMCLHGAQHNNVHVAGANSNFSWVGIPSFIDWSPSAPELHLFFMWLLVCGYLRFPAPWAKEALCLRRFPLTGPGSSLGRLVVSTATAQRAISSFHNGGISKTEEGTPGLEHNKDHAGGFLWHLHSCALWMCPSGSDCWC